MAVESGWGAAEAEVRFLFDMISTGLRPGMLGTFSDPVLALCSGHRMAEVAAACALAERLPLFVQGSGLMLYVRYFADCTQRFLGRFFGSSC
jgi:hypothetical protein